MKVVFLTASLAIFVVMHYGECQTIDEILEAAQNSPDNNVETDDDVLDHPGDSNDVVIVIELDMELEKYDLEEFQTESAVQNHRSRRRRKRKAMRNKRWTNGTIPYRIADGFSFLEQEEILKAIREWNDKTCLNFRPKEPSDSNYIIFKVVYDGTCRSRVGMEGGEQPVKLVAGCTQRKIIVHELGHAIGFFHEQSRTDRDQHVTIQWKNVMANKEKNFAKNDTNTYDIPYDYLSLMHYGQDFFTKERGQPTIITNDPDFQERIGTADTLSERDIKLSERDIKLANTMYNCSEHQQRETQPSLCNDNFSTEQCEFLQSHAFSCTDNGMRKRCKKTCGYCQ